MTARPKYTPVQIVFAIIVGLSLSSIVYFSTISPDSQKQRATEETVVLEAEKLFFILLELPDSSEIISPINENRDVGKTYIYPTVNGGWQVSGYFRTSQGEEWNPWLMNLDENINVIELKVQSRKESFSENISSKSNITIMPIQ